jgi:metal-responsive CopG/Arc/MetJ family transcriptional regulator
MSIISLRLPEELERLLAREAELEHKGRSEIAREAIAEYLARRERERFLGEIARAARARDPAEARRMAEESLPLDNESLDVIEAAEARQPKARYRPRKKSRR